MIVAPPPMATAAQTPNASALMASSDNISHDELVRYVQAYLSIRQLRAAAERPAALDVDQRRGMDGSLRAQVSAILARQDLSRARFNALSAAVEKDVFVRQRMQQIVVDQQLGI